MSNADRDNILAGIYRNLEDADPREALRMLRQIAEQLALIGSVLVRATGVPAVRAPVQASLPLDGGGLPVPGAIASAIAASPRVWGSAAKVYDAIWESRRDRPFTSDEIARDPALARSVAALRVSIPTALRVVSALVKAGAATRVGRAYILRAPTDPLREAVEHARREKRRA